MPLPKGCRSITLLLKHLRNGEVTGLENGTAECAHNAMKPPPMMLTRQHSKTARRADAGGAVSIPKRHSSHGQPINVGRLDLGSGVTIGNIGHPHIISVKNDHVGALLGRLEGRDKQRDRKEGKKIFHSFRELTASIPKRATNIKAPPYSHGLFWSGNYFKILAPLFRRIFIFLEIVVAPQNLTE
jgi:hypothetical protein